jgi:hypothetical protein
MYSHEPRMASCLLYRAGVVPLDNGPCLGQSILSEVKLLTGEPDGEIRQSGSEGGEAELNRPFLPLSFFLAGVIYPIYGGTDPDT